MPLQDILDRNVINLHVKGQNKDEVLRDMSRMLFEQEYIEDIDLFVKDIYLREAEGATGIGNNVSIPHGKCKAVKKIGIAIGRCEHEILWESSVEDDGWQQTRIIFLFCVSADDYGKEHLKLLAELAGKLGSSQVMAKLQKAESKDEIIQALLN
ncbi:PTS fructose transporter subunit IIA [Clostridiales bacterium COT073_COT-073]|nr:PTS fructose transporter subunit IIA [Clostridiales bacterium COT073_COT-073]